MPPVLSRPLSVPINQEWAESLVRLRLDVRDDWWPGYDGDGSNPAVIQHVDFGQTNKRYFQVELDDELGVYYPMRYDAVYLYADENQRGFSRFHLPWHAPRNPDNDTVRIPSRFGRQQRTNDNSGDQTASTALMSDPSLDASSDDRTNDEHESGGSDGEEIKSQTIYTRTDPSDWTCYKNGEAGRTVDPIPFTGDDEEFKVDITDEQAAKLMEDNGDIRFYKVLEWCLPRFRENDNQTLFDWQAVRMQNHMLYIMEQLE